MDDDVRVHYLFYHFFALHLCCASRPFTESVDAMNRFLSSTARGGSSLFSHATTSASAVSASAAASSSGPASLRCTTILAARRLLSSVASSSNDHDDDDSIKVGTVKNFGLKGGFGFIIPDGVDKRTHHAKDLIFIHRNDILVNASETKTGETRYYPR